MRTRTLRTSLALFCLVPAVAAWTAVRAPLTLQPQSRLWVDGTSTVRAFSCAAKEFETKVDATSAGAVRAVLAGEQAVRTASLTVPANALDCRNGTMNEHMRKALKVKEHPTIGFRVTTYEVGKGSAGAVGKATGELSLGGVTKPINVTADVKEEADGTLRITGAYTLKMTDYGLKAPTLMMGTMKVDEKVKVGFDLFLKS
jgi:polyisoprenoid-binding protein YceI